MPLVNEDRRGEALFATVNVQYDPTAEFVRKVYAGEGDIETLITALKKYATNDFRGQTAATPAQWLAIGVDGGEAELRRAFATARALKPYPGM